MKNHFKQAICLLAAAAMAASLSRPAWAGNSAETASEPAAPAELADKEEIISASGYLYQKGNGCIAVAVCLLMILQGN